MKTMTLPDFGTGLHNVLSPIPVDHYFSIKKKVPYCQWAEYGDSRLPGGSNQGEIFYYVQIDLYTNKEFDPADDAVRQFLAKNCVPFDYRLILEEDGKVLHHIYDCNV